MVITILFSFSHEFLFRLQKYLNELVLSVSVSITVIVVICFFSGNFTILTNFDYLLFNIVFEKVIQFIGSEASIAKQQSIDTGL